MFYYALLGEFQGRGAQRILIQGGEDGCLASATSFPGVARLFVFGLAAAFLCNVLLIIGAYIIAKVIVAVLLLEPLPVFPFSIFVFLADPLALAVYCGCWATPEVSPQTSFFARRLRPNCLPLLPPGATTWAGGGP